MKIYILRFFHSCFHKMRIHRAIVQFLASESLGVKPFISYCAMIVTSQWKDYDFSS